MTVTDTGVTHSSEKGTKDTTSVIDGDEVEHRAVSCTHDTTCDVRVPSLRLESHITFTKGFTLVPNHPQLPICVPKDVCSSGSKPKN